MIKQGDKMILGEGCVYSTEPSITQLNNNVIVVGSSGAGKTMSVIEPLFLETNNRSLIVNVSKRKLVEKYTPFFLQRGYKVLDLNFVVPGRSNVSFDPLGYVKGYSDISYLAEAILALNPKKEGNNSADPFWDSSAISLLSSLIAYTLATGDKPTFADVIELFHKLKIDESGNGIVKTNLDHLFEIIEEKDPNHFAATTWKTFRANPIRTASCIYTTLNTVIDNVFTPDIVSNIKKCKQVNFGSISEEKTILFITTSPVNTALNSYVNFFFSVCIKNLFEHAENRSTGSLQLPVHLCCDDFAMAPIYGFDKYISIFREKGISSTILLQSESQLETIYGTSKATTIINNCDTYLFLGSMDLSTGKSISQRTDKPLDEILYMPIGQEILLRRGQKPVFTNRYNIMEDSRYIELTKCFEKKARKVEKEDV